MLRALYERLKASPIGYRLARGAFWSLSGSMLTRGLALLSAILVGRLLGKKEFGELGIIQNTVGMFGALAGCGMGLTANKYVAEFKRTDPSRAGRIIAMASATAWVTGATMLVVLIVFAPWLATHTLAAPHLAGLLQIGSLFLLLGAVNGAQTGALAGFEAFRSIARINLIAGLLTFPLMVAGAWKWGVTGAVWGHVASHVFNCAMSYFALREEARSCNIALGYAGCFSEIGLFWKFSLPSVLMGVLDSMVHWGAGALVVNRSGGYGDMGVYNAAMRVRSIPEAVLSMLVAPIIPMLSEAFGKSDHHSYNKTLRLFLMICVLTVVPACLILSAAPDLTLLPFGAEYRGHPVLVQWLMLHSIFISLNICVSYVLITVGRVWLVWALNLAFAAGYAVFSVLLVPHYGAAGYAASDTLAYFLFTLLSAIVIYRNYPETMRFVGWVRTALPCVLLFAVCVVGNIFLPFSWTIALGVMAALALVALIFLKQRASFSDQPEALTTDGELTKTHEPAKESGALTGCGEPSDFAAHGNEHAMSLTCGISITTKNRLSDLVRTLDMLSRLDPAPDEVSVCADGCTDGTADFVRTKYPQFHLIENTVSQGSIPSRNKLIRESRCDISLSLDDDSYPIETDFIERVCDLFSKRPRLAVATFAQRSDEWPETLDQEDFGAPTFVGSYANCAAAIRRRVFIDLGGYPDQFMHAYEEPDFALRCVNAGFEVRYETRMHVRHHYTSNQRNELRSHHLQARNELLSVMMRCPAPQLFAVAAFRALRQLEYARHRGWSWLVREPVWWLDFLACLPRCLRSRQPIAWEVYEQWLHLVRQPISTEEEWQLKFASK